MDVLRPLWVLGALGALAALESLGALGELGGLGFESEFFAFGVMALEHLGLLPRLLMHISAYSESTFSTRHFFGLTL